MHRKQKKEIEIQEENADILVEEEVKHKKETKKPNKRSLKLKKKMEEGEDSIVNDNDISKDIAKDQPNNSSTIELSK